jgi:hypothetical protein
MPWVTLWGVIGTIFLPGALLWWVTAEQKGRNLSRWPALLLALVGVAGLCCMFAAARGVWPREGLGSESPEDVRTAKNPADRSASAGEFAANAAAARGERPTPLPSIDGGTRTRQLLPERPDRDSDKAAHRSILRRLLAALGMTDRTRLKQTSARRPADAKTGYKDVATDAKATDGARANVVQGDEHEKSTRRAYWPLIAGIGVAATICLATVLVLASGSGRAHAATFRGGDLALSPAGNWHPKTVTVAGLQVESPISIATADSYVLGGAIKHPRPIAADLPLSLSRVYGAPQHATVETLPFGLAKQYTWSATDRHLPLVVFIVSTTAGQIAIACQSRGALSVARIDALCAQSAASARFAGAKVEYPGPDGGSGCAIDRARPAYTRCVHHS